MGDGDGHGKDCCRTVREGVIKQTVPDCSTIGHVFLARARFGEDRYVSWPHHPMAYVGASYVFTSYIYTYMIDVVTREEGRL